MVNVTRLYCGVCCESDDLRYGYEKRSTQVGIRPPVIVWNLTRICNLRCIHCYSDSSTNLSDGELTTDEAKRLIDELVQLRIPRLLISGGEPLMRSDIFELIRHASSGGLKVALSTNGTLIDDSIARELKACGVRYVGISLDGIGEANDEFRGVRGAFERAVNGIKSCKRFGLRVGIRMMLTSRTVAQIDAMFDLAISEGVERLCFYHFIPAGRGLHAMELPLSALQTRLSVERILHRTLEAVERGRFVEVLTVDNPADGAFIYLKLLSEGNERAGEVYKLLHRSGGAFSGSGVGIACIDYVGNVHPDQFWWHYSLGNVRSNSFYRIWFETEDELLLRLRERWKHIHGRCAQCRFFEICGGGMRVRADIMLGDAFASDPACYLNDEEIKLKCGDDKPP
ncbi:MAG: radical SAM protein [Armatimonadota bacterium]|nr:radical SAM protein [Armatimonadota bacterium]MCX7777355.1 radical SAM protein [Armatimonadota bacterium]MDW8025377.1 radical SAM protein [Armatimonadota bacterium]